MFAKALNIEYHVVLLLLMYMFSVLFCFVFFQGFYAGKTPSQSFKFPPPISNNKFIPVDTKLRRGMTHKGGSEKPPNVIPDN